MWLKRESLTFEGSNNKTKTYTRDCGGWVRVTAGCILLVKDDPVTVRPPPTIPIHTAIHRPKIPFFRGRPRGPFGRHRPCPAGRAVLWYHCWTRDGSASDPAPVCPPMDCCLSKQLPLPKLRLICLPAWCRTDWAGALGRCAGWCPVRLAGCWGRQSWSETVSPCGQRGVLSFS